MKASWLVPLLGLLFPVAALPTTSVSQTTISNLQITKDYGATFVFIQVNGTPTGTTSCASGGWNYTLSFSAPGANQLYAMLLTAYATGTQVNMVGTGTCSEVSFVESLDTLQLTQ